MATTLVRRAPKKRLLAAAIIAGILLAFGTVYVVVTRAGSTTGQVGFNWPNAGRVYVAHWDQQSVTAADPSKPFRVAKANDIKVVRVFLGDDVVIDRWRSDPQGVYADIQRMFDDAHANGVKLILVNYLTELTIEKLGATTYPAWADAQRAVTTPGSSAWNGLSNWMQAIVPRFAGHPAAYSWEVTNEPGWMLGIDSGAVSRAQGFSFIDTFQGKLQQHGAYRVNMGGRALYDTSLLTDAEIRQLTLNLDILDDHFYSDSTPDALAGLNAYQNYVTRAKSLAGHPLEVMVGEYGNTPQGWFETFTSTGMARGWLMMAWGYDPYDINRFNETLRPEILAYLKQQNLVASATPTPAAKAEDINKDGQVNVFDLSLLLSRWGTSESAADIDDNGTVNIFDLSRVLSGWGR